MKNRDRIRIEIDVPGVGEEAHEYEYCSIQLAVGKGQHCPWMGFECKYGLTDISPPSLCPLRRDGVDMNFRLIESIEEEQ